MPEMLARYKGRRTILVIASYVPADRTRHSVHVRFPWLALVSAAWAAHGAPSTWTCPWRQYSSTRETAAGSEQSRQQQSVTTPERRRWR